MQISPGREWLAAQDAGTATFTVYTEPVGDEPVDVASIWTTEREARQHAHGHPIERAERMTGTWIYPESDPPAAAAELFAAQVTTRYLEDGMWCSSSHTAYFGTPEERDAFTEMPFIAASRYPEHDAEPKPEDGADVPIDHEAGA